jgi:hypothetical protein
MHLAELSKLSYQEKSSEADRFIVVILVQPLCYTLATNIHHDTYDLRSEFIYIPHKSTFSCTAIMLCYSRV